MSILGSCFPFGNKMQVFIQLYVEIVSFLPIIIKNYVKYLHYQCTTVSTISV
jgi:hypothetical protein